MAAVAVRGIATNHAADVELIACLEDPSTQIQRYQGLCTVATSRF